MCQWQEYGRQPIKDQIKIIWYASCDESCDKKDAMIHDSLLFAIIAAAAAAAASWCLLMCLPSNL